MSAPQYTLAGLLCEGIKDFIPSSKLTHFSKQQENNTDLCINMRHTPSKHIISKNELSVKM
jgi:hypothetical protein